MFEVEQKYSIDDPADLTDRLAKIGGRQLSTQQHSDTYYNHPSKDFAETREALRIRRVDGVPMVTYKGSKLPGTIKARRELEWRLDPGDADGTKMEELLVMLGFRLVATVKKVRRSFELLGKWAEITVVVDEVEGVGRFAEVEMMAKDAQHVEDARRQIEGLAGELGLHQPEQRSYLRMLLEANSG